MSDENKTCQESRREFVKKLAYIAPVVVTLTALPSFASAGSGYNGGDDRVYKRGGGHGGGRGDMPHRRDRRY